MSKQIYNQEEMNQTLHQLKETGGKVLVKTLKKQGFIFLRTPYNRDVNQNHVQQLIDNVKRIGHFLNPIQVISGTEYFSIYPERSITLESGKTISFDFPELYRTLIVIDGQHRNAAEEEMGIEKDYIPTLKAEYLNLPEGITPDEWTTSTNTTGKNWISKDRANFIRVFIDDPNTNIAIMGQIQHDYGIGDRYAIALLNFQDNYNKRYQVEFMNHPEKGLPSVLKGTPENQKRGLETLHAMEVGFRNCPKAMKKMTTIKFVIEVYSETPDNKKTEVVRYLQLFLMNLDNSSIESIASPGFEMNTILILKGKFEKFLKAIRKEESLREYEEAAIIAEREWSDLAEKKLRKKSQKRK